MADNGIIIFKIAEFPHISETFILNQIRTAIDLGYNVKILTNVLLDYKNRSKSKILEDYNLLEKVILEDYKIPKNRIKRFFKWFKLLIVNFRNIFKIIAFHFFKKKFSLTWLFVFDFYWNMDDVKLFHVQYGTNKSSLPELKAVGFKPRLICQFHGHDAFFPINGIIKEGKYYNDLFNYCDRIIVNTPYLENQLLEIGCSKNKLLKIPVTINLDEFKPNINMPKSSIFTLITVGRLCKSKGHIFILRTLKRLIKYGLNIRLVIIGAGPELERLKAYSRNNNLSNYLEFTGAKSSYEIIKYLNQSQLFVFTPTTMENGWGESQGVVVLEAMACELPVVCFDTGGVKYTFRDRQSGFLIPEGDMDELFLKIKSLYENPRMLNEMGKNARLFVLNNYSNARHKYIWDALYKCLP